ncbi:hypothetical protein VSR01_36565 [Actinacidiphila sp. DG2A-62]|uniref:hypothetical protein n=1 Tax=Actinacidiphila sp. DG2A-62 TaxID=3108821 RepID=UPI002DBEF771|nr:hypothetical protein [Actinacidiphila sp. DG2A-62]MEC3998708.1 hypothetical protein [Actinacidiphila sp. DG2A-62]
MRAARAPEIQFHDPQDEAPRRAFPARVSRATVAAAVLDEAETRAHAGATLVPVER